MTADWFDNLNALDEPQEWTEELQPLVEGDDGYSEAVYGAAADLPAQRHEFAPRQRSYLDLGQVSAAKAHIQRLPEDGETIHMILPGTYTPFNFIPATIELAGPLDELVLATLTYSKDNAADLLELYDTQQAERIKLLVSHWFSRANSHLYLPLHAEMRRRGQQMGCYRNHTKIWLMRAGEAHYVIEGSCNLRSCKCLENAAMSRSRELYQFHKGWIEGRLAKAAEVDRNDQAQTN